MNITAFDLAQRYIGIKELVAGKDHPVIQFWLSLCGFPTDVHDEVPWCSAFVNGIAWELRLPRSKSAAARSWLAVGRDVKLVDAVADGDIVILKRGEGQQPDATVFNAPGHVGFYAGLSAGNVLVLGGNQDNAVGVAPFSNDRLLGIRRLT